MLDARLTAALAAIVLMVVSGAISVQAQSSRPPHDANRSSAAQTPAPTEPVARPDPYRENPPSPVVTPSEMPKPPSEQTDFPLTAADEATQVLGEQRPEAGTGKREARSTEERETAPVSQPLGITEAPSTAPRPEDITLTVATWNSAYNQAQKRVLLDPFQADAGYQLKIVSHGGDLAKLGRSNLEAAGWDVIELSSNAAQRGCKADWLATIDATQLPKGIDGALPPADYLPGALMPCAVGSAAWSAVIVFDSRAEFDEQPRSVRDLFDLERFPGMRALPRQARYTLEFALMGDGVAPDEVYEVLATPEGQDRAFTKLSAIRHAIVWWSDAAKALAPFPAKQSKDSQDVVMGIAFNGRVFTNAVRARRSLRILWDGQIYHFNYWAIPQSSPNRAAAKEFLRYASMPERQARQTKWFPYGPVRRSALPLIRRHAEIDLEMSEFVPTMPKHMNRALKFDARWWAQHGKALHARFQEWLSLPKPQVPADQLVPPTPVKASRPSL